MSLSLRIHHVIIFLIMVIFNISISPVGSCHGVTVYFQVHIFSNSIKYLFDDYKNLRESQGIIDGHMQQMIKTDTTCRCPYR